MDRASFPSRLIKLVEHERFGELRRNVAFIDPSTVYLPEDTAIICIGDDSIIYPNVCFAGYIRIGESCIIGANSTLINIITGKECIIESSKISDTMIGCNVSIGPFSLIEQSHIADECTIGFTAQVKRSRIGKKTFARHHCYIGDADVGKNVNIAAGAITGNYGGIAKNKTVIADGVFIGINVNLIAPVTIGSEGYIGAGAIIKKDVVPHSIVVGLDRVLKNKRSYRLEQGWDIREG